MGSTTNNNGKRLRTDEIEKLDDSIETMISDLQANADPSNKDLANFFIDFIRSQNEFRHLMLNISQRTDILEQRVETAEKRTDDVMGRVEENVKSIEILHSNAEKVRTQVSEIEASTHKMEQFHVDNDIFLSGFPTKPDCEEVTKSLIALYDIPESQVNFKYQYEFEIKRKFTSSSTPNHVIDKKVIHHVVIGFKDKFTKSKFMAAKKMKGPLTYEQLNPRERSDEHKTATIKCTNRLSKFNLKVQRELMRAKMENKLHSFQLHYGWFRLKKEEQSQWIIIDTENALNPYRSKE